MSGEVNGHGRVVSRNEREPFYVANGECIRCGVPEHCAPELISHDLDGHCVFRRQPETANELNRAIAAVWFSCVAALRYRGKDHDVLVRLAELGMAECCDHRLPNEPQAINVNHVTFGFQASQLGVPEQVARDVMESLQKSFSVRRVGRCTHIQVTPSGDASFDYVWSGSAECRVTLLLETCRDRWLLRILRPDMDSTAFMIHVQDWMDKDPRFQNLEWFTEEEWLNGGRAPRKRGY